MRAISGCHGPRVNNSIVEISHILMALKVQHLLQASFSLDSSTYTLAMLYMRKLNVSYLDQTRRFSTMMDVIADRDTLHMVHRHP